MLFNCRGISTNNTAYSNDNKKEEEKRKESEAAEEKKKDPKRDKIAALSPDPDFDSSGTDSGDQWTSRRKEMARSCGGGAPLSRPQNSH